MLFVQLPGLLTGAGARLRHGIDGVPLRHGVFTQRAFQPQEEPGARRVVARWTGFHLSHKPCRIRAPQSPLSDASNGGNSLLPVIPATSPAAIAAQSREQRGLFMKSTSWPQSRA
ncbi:MAG: hypothetical protein JNK87_11660 [Bryobacterales bacterium]|nr:hypothetical protein [Bryobacterales bacterium]